MDSLAIQQEQGLRFPVSATAKHKAIVVATKAEKLKNTNPNWLTAYVMEAINRAYALAGGGKQDETYKAQLTACGQVLVNRFVSGFYGNLTTTEFTTAIEEGATGLYGEFYGVNAKSITSWIRSYQNKKAEVMKKQSAYEAELAYELQQKAQNDQYKAQAAELRKNRLKEEYEKLVKGDINLVGDFGDQFYLWLTELGVIPKPHPDANSYLEQATEQYKQEAKAGLNKPKTRHAARNLLANWQQLVGNKHPRIVTICRNLILNDYLRQCALEELEFNQILKPGK